MKRSLRPFPCAAAGLAVAFGAGMLTGIGMMKQNGGGNAGAGRTPEMHSPASIGNRNSNFPQPAGPEKRVSGGAIKAGGIFSLAGLTPEDAWSRLSAMDDRAARRGAVLRFLKGLPADQWLPWLDKVTDGMEDAPDGSDFDLMARLFTTVEVCWARPLPPAPGRR